MDLIAPDAYGRPTRDNNGLDIVDKPTTYPHLLHPLSKTNPFNVRRLSQVIITPIGVLIPLGPYDFSGLRLVSDTRLINK